MTETINLSVSIPKDLFDQAEHLAQQLNISHNQLIEQAIEQFIPQTEKQNESDQRVIHQGDVYWIQDAGLSGSTSDIPHPYVVIQDDLFNHSRIQTVVVCALTSNINRASIRGNVLLDVEEANLPKQSVVEVSKVSAVDKAQLGDYIGSLTVERIGQILDGLRFQQVSYFER